MKLLKVALVVACSLAAAASCGTKANEANEARTSSASSPSLAEHPVGRVAAADLGPSCPTGPLTVLSAPTMTAFGQTVEATCAGSSGATLTAASTLEAEQAITTRGPSGAPIQQVAPMVRPLSPAAICATQVGSPSTAASMAVGLDAVAVTSRVEDANGGGAAACTLAYSDPAGAPKVIPAPTPSCPDCTYTINPGDWRDVLRILYAGVDHDGNKDCNSAVRTTLANSWQSIFESTCGSNCTQLAHVFRLGDFDDATDAFLSILGLPPASQNPFCNGWGAPFAKTGDADYVDADPIRRDCSPVRYQQEGDGDQVCSRDGKLGLVLPIVVPQPSATSAWAQDPSQVYPATMCTRYWFIQPPPGLGCPDGTAPNPDGTCFIPLTTAPDGSDDYTCITPGKLGDPLAPPTGVDERVFNLQLRAPDGSIRLDERGRPITGAFYRLRTFASGHVFAAGVPATTCTAASSDAQLACLSTDVPCSLGLRSYSSTAATPSPFVNVAGVGPSTTTIQNIVAAPSQAYPLAHKVYLNSVLGLANLAGAEERLGVCWTRPSLALSAGAQGDIVDLPGGSSCEDFDETACGAATNVDACAAGAPSCAVDVTKELEITSVSVVEDKIRTAFDPAFDGDPRQGAFTIKHILDNISVSPDVAPDNLETFLRDFIGNVAYMQTQPNDSVEVSPLVAARDPSTGKLDLTQAPFRLLAIVSRIDLRDLSSGSAGEARFVFGAVNPADGTAFSGKSTPAGDQNSLTLIFEFTLPAQTEADALAWAQAWHALGALPRPTDDHYTDADETYNSALQALTDRVIARGAMPGQPNGSALAHLRVRDNGQEMREFIICPTDVDSLAPGGCRVSFSVNGTITKLYPEGWIIPNPVAKTPFFGAQRDNLGSWVFAHEPAVRAGKYDLNDVCMPDDPGVVTNSCLEMDFYADFETVWDMPNVSSDLRHAFAINTCNGCHQAETGNDQFQIAMRPQGQPSKLSQFLTGAAKVVPFNQDFFNSNHYSFDSTPRHFNDLERRAADLRNIVCPLSCP